MSTIVAFDNAVARVREIENSFLELGVEEIKLDLVKTGVADTAAVLDEHVPGWHTRITEPLQMGSCRLCVLGQVFKEAPRRRFFGLFPAKGSAPLVRSGYALGLEFFAAKGIEEPPFVFTCEKARPFWDAEIARRSA